MEKSLPEKIPLPKKAYIICGWPLVLVIIGGAIGGLLGGAAFGINLKIYKSSLPIAAKIIFNILTGAAAYILWVITVQLIRSFVQT